MKDPSLNSDKHEIKKLTADILRKYHQGKLESREMHLIEKMLLDDPLAVEALEGIETMDNPASSESIESDLNLQISRRTEKAKTKVVPIYQKPWNIAAALVLLLVASWLLFDIPGLFNPSSPESQGPIALEKSTVPNGSEEDREQKIEEEEGKPTPLITGDTILIAEELESEQLSEDKVTQDVKNQSLKDEQTLAKITSPPVKENDRTALKEDEAVTIDQDVDLALGADHAEDTGEIAKPEITAQEKIRKKEAQAPVTNEHRARDFSRSTEKAAKLSIDQTASRLNNPPDFQKTISGQVISAEDGQGLPGVTLSVKGSNTGVLTDINGNYRLQVNESDSILVYSFIGYETEEIIVKEQESVDIALEPDRMALEEVVVVAYGDEGESEAFIPVIGAQPEVGSSSYKRYLKDSLRYPAEALKNEIEGKVKVTFFVQPNGALSDFKVKRSLGYGCDEEVIRLIKEGSDWQPAKKGETPIKQKVRVKVRFKLEK